mmetsp:Transcript_30391/g.48776  ORF Transcript_30391/g.48776 Transcript_30391/m.48776 type:complete len:81 (+) Transcript_30391:155-397(+)
MIDRSVYLSHPRWLKRPTNEGGGGVFSSSAMAVKPPSRRNKTPPVIFASVAVQSMLPRFLLPAISLKNDVEIVSDGATPC